MQIGFITLSDSILTPEMEHELNSYIKKTGDTVNDISQEGIYYPDLLSDPSHINKVRLLAGIKALSENPQNGLIAIEIAKTLKNLGRIKESLEILAALKKAGCPGCFSNIIYEDPDFLSGWMLFENKDYSQALEHYMTVISKSSHFSQKYPLYVHLALTFHKLNTFLEAQKNYEKAIDELESEILPLWQSKNDLYLVDHYLKQKDVIEKLSDDAHQKKPLKTSISLAEDGIDTY